MPQRDGTGPLGQGPRTGGGMGNCPLQNEENDTTIRGRGMGPGKGRGMGRGRGRRGRGRGRGGRGFAPQRDES